MLFKSIENSIKSIDTEKNIVCGYFATFGVKDHDGDIIEKGAFEKSLESSGIKVKHLLEHDKQKQIGKIQVLKEDETGLYFESKMLNTQTAKDVLELYKEGVYSEHSIGFNVIKQKFDKERNANIISEIKLYEGSTVSWGANSFTPVVGIKELTHTDIIEQINLIETLLRKDKFSEEFYKTLQLKLIDLNNILKESLPEIKKELSKADALKYFNF